MWVQEGEGWRLVFDASRGNFRVLLGGSGWAAELDEPEARALQSGVARLLEQHAALKSTLMSEESITLELEVMLKTGALWIGLEGDRNLWGLRFVLTPGPGARGLEGSWSNGASAPFAAALAQLGPLGRGADGETRDSIVEDQQC